ncbi:Putative LptA-related OstA-like protein [Candidatus Bealeia paramacronuclearis]|uniref:LptA-related OstA-like protein n=1 Tax=Candidatus Bealeia paramacronuclearis TaxID=1921001 RepID=A0ABZ2C430_9PROT|nr:putative LptA-related OstA-like protein [Candidatus Bealeia paramacronuclearis]
MKIIFLLSLTLLFSTTLQAEEEVAKENSAANLLSLGQSGGSIPIVIDADESVVCDEATNSCVATGNARAQRGTFVVNGTKLTVYFKGSGHDREIKELMADGNVSLVNPTEAAYGDHAHYDVALDRVILTGGDLKLVTPDQLITARDSLEFWQIKHQGIARGDAVAHFPKKEQVVEADTLIAYFVPKEEREKNTKNKEDSAKDKMSLKKIEAEGNVLVSTPKEIASGDRGVYNAAADMSELFGNVKITQGGNHIRGEYAIMNMKTNVAQLFAKNPNDPVSDQKPKRIRGIIMPKDAKNMRKADETKKSSEAL